MWAVFLLYQTDSDETDQYQGGGVIQPGGVQGRVGFGPASECAAAETSSRLPTLSTRSFEKNEEHYTTVQLLVHDHQQGSAALTEHQTWAGWSLRRSSSSDLIPPFHGLILGTKKERARMTGDDSSTKNKLSEHRTMLLASAAGQNHSHWLWTGSRKNNSQRVCADWHVWLWMRSSIPPTVEMIPLCPPEERVQGQQPKQTPQRQQPKSHQQLKVIPQVLRTGCGHDPVHQASVHRLRAGRTHVHRYSYTSNGRPGVVAAGQGRRERER